MPARQPVRAINRIEDPLVRAYARAWLRVTELYDGLRDDPRQWRKAARLREQMAAISGAMDEVDKEAADWLRREFPKVFAMGGAQGAAEAGGAAAFTWNQAATEAVNLLANDLFDDLLGATQTVRQSTKKLVRQVVRDEVLQKMIAGDTAKAAGKRAAQIIEANKVHAIKYRDGSLHGLDEYTQMAVRTKTAVAYNTGALTGAEAQGVKYFEVFDGPFCGWSFHDDRQALGMIVTKDEALTYPISHPNCRRAFGARPDVNTAKEAKAARGSVTDAQRKAQIAQDTGTKGRSKTSAAASRRDQRLSERRQALETRRRAAEAAQAKKSAPKLTPKPEPKPSLQKAPGLRPDVASHIDDMAGRNFQTGELGSRVADELRNQATHAPDAVRGITVREMDAAMSKKLGRDTLAGYEGNSRTMYVSKKNIGPNAEAAFKRDIDKNWFSKCDHDHGSVESTVAHEFGHHLDELLRGGNHSPSGTPAIKELYAEVASALDVGKPMLYDTGSLAKWGERNKATITAKVSRYGATHPDEMLAEIWAEYTTAATPRPHVKKIGDAMKRLLEGKR